MAAHFGVASSPTPGLPGKPARVLLEGADGAVTADGREAHDDLGALRDRLSAVPAGEIGGGEAEFGRVELDLRQCRGRPRRSASATCGERRDATAN